MYEFIDIMEIAESDLPSEALQLNGEYLEDIIPGYRTLTVSGREALNKVIKSFETGIRHGTTLQSSRYPERIITVTYQILTKTNEEFREAYNILGSLLSLDESELVFADEPDKFFIGTCTKIDVPRAGTNCVVGTLEFTCNDPFKYSVEEYEVSPSIVGSKMTVEDEFMVELINDDGDTTELVEPAGQYASYAKGQVLSYAPAGAVELLGEDSIQFTQGVDYVVDGSTVYVKENMLAEDIMLDGWRYETNVGAGTEKAAQFVINYNGTAKGHPVMVAEFNEGTEDEEGNIEGDACGFLAFIDDEKNIIQLGDDDQEDEGAKIKGTVQRYTNWAKGKGTKYFSASTAMHNGVSSTGGTMGVTTYLKANKKGGTKKVKIIGSGKKKRKKVIYINPSDIKVLRPKSYGSKPSKDKWYGHTICTKIPKDEAGNLGAKNCTFSLETIMASTKNTQRGRLNIELVSNKNGARKSIARILISKASDSANATIYHWVKGVQIPAINKKINLQKYNTRFGLSKKLYKKVRDKKGETRKWKSKHRGKKKFKWLYDGWSKPKRTITVQKKGQAIIFNVAGVKHTYRDKDITDMLVNEIYITFGAQSGHKPLGYFGVQEAKFLNATPEVEVDIKNTFSIGDTVIVDTMDGSIDLNGEDAANIGALGNDWETFTLEKGVNSILATWSDWAETNPNIKIKYREVYI